MDLEKEALNKHYVDFDGEESLHIDDAVLLAKEYANYKVSYTDILEQDVQFYKGHASDLEFEVERNRAKIITLYERLNKLLKWWPVKLFYPIPIEWDFQDMYNEYLKK